MMTLFYFYDIFDYYDFKISQHKERKEPLMVQLSHFYTVMQLKSLFYLYRTGKRGICALFNVCSLPICHLVIILEVFCLCPL